MALIVIAAALLDPHRAFPGWWAVLPVAGGALLLSAPSAWGVHHLLASPPIVRIGLISYPLYLWHCPLLVFAATIKFAPLTPLESELVVLASALLAWATYRFVEIPVRFGRPSRLGLAGLGATMVLIAIAGVTIVDHGGLASRLPPEIRDMAEVRPQSAKWRVHTCLLDLAHETAFAHDCVDRDRRPLVLVWGDSTAGALMPGLRKAQEIRDFGIAQLTSSSCLPALNVDIAATPNCRATNDEVLALARRIQPDIVLLHGAFAQHLDHAGETVTALKQATGARVVVLGPAPGWIRGLPNEVLRHYLLHHELIPQRNLPGRDDESLRRHDACRSGAARCRVHFGLGGHVPGRGLSHPAQRRRRRPHRERSRASDRGGGDLSGRSRHRPRARRARSSGGHTLA
jgi:hypothetical protein